MITGSGVGTEGNEYQYSNLGHMSLTSTENVVVGTRPSTLHVISKGAAPNFLILFPAHSTIANGRVTSTFYTFTIECRG